MHRRSGTAWRRGLRGLLVLVLALGLAAPGTAGAQRRDREEKKEAERREKQGRQYTISNQRTGKRLAAALELLHAEEWEQALTLLDEFDLDTLNPYETAAVHQFRAHAYASMDRYPEASEQLKLTLAQEALPYAGQLQARFNLAQMYLLLERYDEAVEQLETWFAETEAPTSSAYYLLALAHYQGGDAEGALAPAEKAVRLAEEPREAWLQLLVALYLSEQRWKDAQPLVEQLVTRFPKKAYWVQLAAIYYSLEQDTKSFAVQQLAELQGLLTTDRELRRLAQMYLYNDLPYRAAAVLGPALEEGRVESDRDAWQLLGTSLLAAKEYAAAIAPLRRAADLSEDGESWLRLGQVHVQREEWEEAVRAVQNALGKGLDRGGPNTPCHGHLLIGIARYNQKRLGAARVSAARARACEKTREMSDRWLRFLEHEEMRLKALEG